MELELDKLLKIKTTGRDDSNSDLTNFPYEPTPYSVLELLANSGYLSKNDVVIDFGSGKGRVDFYLAYYLKCHMIGVEYDNRLFQRAISNLKDAKSKSRVEFVLKNASEYEIPNNAKALYFFNPFNVSVLIDVINNLKESIKKNKRNVLLIFYYPSNKYLEYLNSEKDIKHIDDLDCKELFNNDSREVISIYKI